MEQNYLQLAAAYENLAAAYRSMPERVENNVEVVMALKEQKLYDDFKRDMVLQLGDDELDAVNAAALSNKLPWRTWRRPPTGNRFW